MRPPETVYRGERVENENGAFVGVRVAAGDSPLSLPPSWRLGCEFDWGRGDLAAAQLALAILLDATGDAEVACRHYTVFKWAKVARWGSTWKITAGEVARWVEAAEREAAAEPPEPDPDAEQLRGERLRRDPAHAPPEANADDWLRRMFDERGGEL